MNCRTASEGERLSWYFGTDMCQEGLFAEGNVEFPNQYGFDAALDSVKSACGKLVVSKFELAKAGHQCRYSVDELMAWKAF